MERFDLSTLCVTERKNRKVVGRGIGSGKGKTAGKGHKGAKARSGAPAKPFFEGGQTPIYRRLPKRGFTNVTSTKSETFVLSMRDLSRMMSTGIVASGDILTLDLLKEKGIVSKRFGYFKLIGGDCNLPRQISLKVNAATVSAKEKVINSGGTVEVL